MNNIKVFLIIRMLDESELENFNHKNSYEKKRDVLHKYMFSNRMLIKDAIDIEKCNNEFVSIKYKNDTLILKDGIQYNFIGKDNKILSAFTISSSIRKSLQIKRLTKRSIINFYVTLKELASTEYEILDPFTIIDKLEL